MEEASEEGRVGVVGYGQFGTSFPMPFEFIRYRIGNRLDPVLLDAGLVRPRSRGKAETEYRLRVRLIIGGPRNGVNTDRCTAWSGTKLLVHSQPLKPCTAKPSDAKIPLSPPLLKGD